MTKLFVVMVEVPEVRASDADPFKVCIIATNEDRRSKTHVTQFAAPLEESLDRIRAAVDEQLKGTD